MPHFSGVIATRNRPQPFQAAIGSVISQSMTDLEVIVVDDGSSTDCRAQYDAILRDLATAPLRLLALPAKPGGHGGGYARNFGAWEARARYLCFLDDDYSWDSWTDPDHLARAQSVILTANGLVDLYMANQLAFRGDQQLDGPIWIEDLPGILNTRGALPDESGAYPVTVDDLLRSQGFCHLNTLIVRRGLFEEVGSFEDTIRWEEDRDLYLRLIDRAGLMKFFPRFVARHNVPDPSVPASMTTSLSELERRLFQTTVFDRARYLSDHESIRAYATRQKAYTLKRVVESLVTSGRHKSAAVYAREAFSTAPTLKWGAYTAWRILRAFGANRQGSIRKHS